MMKRTLFTFIFLIIGLSGLTQNIEKHLSTFIRSIEANDTLGIITKGNYLIDQWDSREQPLDSLQVDVRLITALNIWKAGYYEKSLNLNIETLGLIEEQWGVNNRDYSTCLNNISRDYEALGAYEKAIISEKENLLIIKRTQGELNRDYANALFNISRNYSILRKRAKSIDFYSRSLNIYLEVEDESSRLTSNCIFELSRELVWKGDSLSSSRALPLLNKYINLSKNYNRDQNINYCNAHYYIGQANSNLANHASKIYKNDYVIRTDSLIVVDLRKNAKSYYSKAKNLYDRLNYQDYEIYLINLHALSISNEYLGNYEEALEISKIYSEKCKSFYGDDSEDYFSALLNQVHLLRKLGLYKKAERIINDLDNKFVVKELDPKIQILFYSTNAEYLREKGDLLGTIENYKNKLALEKELFGTKSPSYLITCRLLSNYLFEVGDVENGLKYSKIILKLFEDRYSKNSNEYVHELYRHMILPLSNAYTSSENQKLREYLAPFIDKATNQFLHINENATIDMDLQNSILASINFFYNQEGRHIEVLALERNSNSESLNVVDVKKQLREDIELSIRESKNLSYVGNHNKADRLISGILSKYDSIPKELLRKVTGHKAYTSYMIGALFEARKYAYMTDSLWGEDYYSDKFKLRLYINNLNQLWSIESKLQNIKTSNEIQKKIRSLVIKNFEEKDAFYISQLFLYATRLFFHDNLEDAEVNFRKAMLLEEKFGDPDNNDLYRTSQIRLAKILASNREYREADSLFMVSINFQLNKFKSDIVELSLEDFEYLKYARVKDCLDFINYALYRKNDNPSLFYNAVDNWLYLNNLKLRKGRVLREVSSNSKLGVKYHKQLRTYSKALQQPPWTLYENGIRIDSLKLEVKKTEMAIGAQNTMLGFDRSIHFIQQNLKEGEAFILSIPFIYRDYNQYQGAKIETERGKQSYLFIKIVRGTNNIEYRLLENGQELDGIYFTNYSNYYLDPEKNVANDEMSYLVYFKPIEELFYDSKKVFLKTDGIFEKISLEGLYNPNIERFIFEDYNISYRDVLSNKNDDIIKIESGYLFGGVDFGDGSNLARELNQDRREFGCIVGIQLIIRTEGLSVEKVIDGSSAAKQGVQAGDIIIQIEDEVVSREDLDELGLDYFILQIKGKENTEVKIKCLREATGEIIDFVLVREFPGEVKPKLIFSSLPGSKNEVNTLEKLLQSNNVKTEKYMDGDASEVNLKKIKSPSILHLATHSFVSIPNTNDPFMGVLDDYRSGNPLLFNTLVLAGVNDFNFWSKEFDEENGYVNALELSLLDLRDTYLTVLSSCESGSGASGIGEGIFGFKEALYRAGVENVILSKHLVADNVTVEFFQDFYQNLFKSERSIHDVLRITKLEFIEKYDHPYYWNAFVHF